MNKESEPSQVPSPASQTEGEPSGHGDLQYISVELDGTTYGGWYRLLPDGQMELLALANMHSEYRTENTPLEQARGMLTDFVRAAHAKSQRIDAPGAGSGRMLGDLLFADRFKQHIPEREWTTLVLCSAAGDVIAFHGLVQRTHDMVFVLILRLTRNAETAEELTLKVFETLWQRAPAYDPAVGTVVAWIMNQARTTAINHLRFIGCLAGDEGDAVPPDTAAEQIDALCFNTLWGRLVQRIALPPDEATEMSPALAWMDPPWMDVAPGISCKLLATDVERDRVSMLVRLAPGTSYPSHTHGGVEELHLLQGQLWIDARRLHAGDYSRAQPGTIDHRVWSETGCTGVLVTSTRDAII